MYRSILILFYLAFWGTLSPLAAQFEWHNDGEGTGYDDAVSNCTDGEGNTYVFGQMGASTATYNLVGGGTTTLTNNGSNDVFVAKYDPLGQLVWIRNFGGTGTERPWSIATVNNGPLVIVGLFGSQTLQFGATPALALTGGTDGFITALDPQNGDPLWAKSIEGPGDSDFRDVQVTCNGVFAVGSLYGASATVDGNTIFNSSTGYLDMMIARFDLDGTLVYLQNHGASTGDHTAHRLEVFGDRVYILGRYSGVFTLPGGTHPSPAQMGASDLYVTAMDADDPNMFFWLTTGGGTSTDNFFAITTDHEGEVYVLGDFQSPTFTIGSLPPLSNANPTTSDIATIKLDHLTGNPIWIRGGIGSDYDWAHGMEADDCGNIHIVGSYSGMGIDFDGNFLTGYNAYRNSFLVTYDQNGNVLAAQGLVSPNSINEAKDVAISHDNQPIIVGRYTVGLSFPGAGSAQSLPPLDYNFYIAKGNLSGGSNWQQTSSNSIGSAFGKDVVVDCEGSVYITGNFEEVTTFGNIGNSVTLNGGGGTFTAKYSNCGELQWVTKTQNGASGANSITIDEKNGWVYVCGSFFPTVAETFESGMAPSGISCGTTLSGSGASFIVRYDMDNGCLDDLHTFGGDYHVKSLDIDSEGNIYLAAEYTLGGVKQIATSKFTSSYGFQWFQSTNNAAGSDCSASDIVLYETAGGNKHIYVTGGFQQDFEIGSFQALTSANSDAYVFDIRETGGTVTVNWLSQGNVSQNASGKSVTIDTLGNAYLTGSFRGTMLHAFGAGTLTSVGLSTAFVARLDKASAGVASWAERIYAPGSPTIAGFVIGTGVSADKTGLYVTGHWHGGELNTPLVFPLSQGISSPLFNGNSGNTSELNVYVARFSFDNSSVNTWGTSSEGPSNHRAQGVAVNNSHYVYTTGHYNGTMDLPPFNQGALGQITATPNASDAFLIRNDQWTSEFLRQSVGIEPQSLSEGPVVFPNPSPGQFEVRFPWTTSSEIMVFDLQGKLIHTATIVGGHASIDLHQVAQGSYILKWMDKESGKSGHKKLIVQ